MAVLVLCYSEETPHSLLPTSCSLESGSHIQSIVTTSGFLSPGRYLILPLSFNHYRHATKKLGATHPTVSVEGDQREENGNGNGVPYVMAVFSAQELAYENVSTRPGFLPESLMLLAEKTGKVTEVLYTVHSILMYVQLIVKLLLRIYQCVNRLPVAITRPLVFQLAHTTVVLLCTPITTDSLHWTYLTVTSCKLFIFLRTVVPQYAAV